MNGSTTQAESKTKGFEGWLSSKQYWEQHLWSLHLEKDELEDSDIEKCYQYLLEDSGVIKTEVDRIPIVFPVLELEGTDAPGAKYTLDKIENLKNVNAIDEGCVVDFGKNLTIIYGDNGAGKSGIGRLLSNACLSRKPRKLLANARKVTYPASRPTAEFHVSDASGPSVISYTLGDMHQPLKAFSVFDHECAPIHLNSENKVEFVPAKIKVFDDVFKSISIIEAKLQAETDAKECDNPTENVFEGTSLITDFMEAISHETTDKEIDDALKFVSADKKALSEKKKEHTKKMKQDISAQKTLLQEECADLETFKSTLATTSTALSKTREIQINAILKEIREKREIADKLSARSFDFAAFKNIGSPEWKSLIVAAQALHDKETSSSGGVEPTHCVLCHQALTNKEKTLFGNYWEFLKSTVETELTTARGTLATYVEKLERADTSWPAFSATEVAVKILKKEAPQDLKKIKASFDGFNTQLRDWIDKAKKEKDVTYTNPKIDLNPIAKHVAAKRKAEGKLVDPAHQINELYDEIGYLEQKQQASRLIPKIKKYVAWLRWHKATSSINLPSVRGVITGKKREIMEEIVISQYVDIFNDETKQLDCNFGLKVESHGRHGDTIKELKLNFARGYNPSEILSEGEQTVSALADFLTEAKLDKNNSGIIFDDPVTSLDHDRRSTIAQRLVKEAKDRQVVVLTHDIIFLLDLQHYAEAGGVDAISVSIRKSGGSVGLVKPELPWIALDVKKKVAYLRNKLVAVKKVETGDPDEYRDQVKLWYMLLRESWERAIEERLFKGVIQRFNKGVQTKRLAKVAVTDALIKEVTDGMTESSNWLHDMAAGVNPAVPTTAKLEEELKTIAEFIAKCQVD